MKNLSRIRTRSTTITGPDVRKVVGAVCRDIRVICRAAGQVAADFDADQAEMDCSLLAMHEVVSAFQLQFYLEDELIREYCFEIATGQLQASGPSADQPPVATMPWGARVRLIVSHNLETPQDTRDHWFRKLGWIAAKPLRAPANARYEVYGTHVSGGYGVVRKLLCNPKFDQPVDRPISFFTRKEG